MKNRGHLRAQRVGKGQTEVRVDVDGVELTVPKTLDTTEVLSVLMRCCGVTNLAAFGDFTKQLHNGELAEIQCYDLDGVIKEWGLRSLKD